MTASSSLRVVVLGYIVHAPLGGLAWHHLQYAMGLSRLGHEVCYLEDSGDAPYCYDPGRGVVDDDPTYGLTFLDRALDGVGLGGRWAYYDAPAAEWRGPLTSEAAKVCESADLLLNLSGLNPLRPWTMVVPRRVFIDTDPVFTQVRHLTDPAARAVAAAHDAHFTFAENIARGTATVPDDGFSWRPTRQPVVLAAWPVTTVPEGSRFTTVMKWDSYPSVVYGGRRFGMKSDSFEEIAGLAVRLGDRVELAVGATEEVRTALRRQGWQVRDSLGLSLDPWDYQRYIQDSRGEFGVAKHGYVEARTGWFSERSANYLASGRPVVAQETGFSEWLASDGGVLAFSTPEEAVAALEEVAARPDHHGKIARAAAEEYFDSVRVLGELIAASSEQG